MARINMKTKAPHHVFRGRSFTILDKKVEVLNSSIAVLTASKEIELGSTISSGLRVEDVFAADLSLTPTALLNSEVFGVSFKLDSGTGVLSATYRDPLGSGIWCTATAHIDPECINLNKTTPRARGDLNIIAWTLFFRVLGANSKIISDDIPLVRSESTINISRYR